MSGSDGEGASPSKLDECVSQSQLQKALQAVQSDLAETITRAVTKLHLGESIERLDKRVSKLTDQVVELETAHKTINTNTNNNTNTNTNTNNDVEDDHDEAMVYKADGTVDRSTTRTARL